MASGNSSQCVLLQGLVVRWFLNGLTNKRMMFLLAVKTGDSASPMGSTVSGTSTIEMHEICDVHRHSKHSPLGLRTLCRKRNDYGGLRCR